MSVVKVSFPRPLRIVGKIVWWAFAAALGLFTAAAVGLYLMCMFQGEEVASLLEKRLYSATDVRWEIRGSIRPVFFPKPGLAVKQVRLLAADDHREGAPGTTVPLLSLERVKAELNVPFLLQGTLWPGRIELDSPVFVVSAGASAESAPPLAGERVEQAAPDGTDAFPAVATFLRRMRQRGLPPVLVRNGTLKSLNPRGEPLVELTGVEARLNPELEGAPLAFSAFLAVPAADLSATLAGSVSLGGGDTLAQGRLQGRIRLAVPGGTRPVEGEFSTSVQWKEKGAVLTLPDLAVSAEGDSLTADLRADIPALSCTGKVTIAHLSLPRWFLFGRNLPPGLQAVLGNVRGSFDLSLTPSSAEALSLKGTAGDISLEGYVGVTDFSRPVVKVDAATASVNLDPIFPFLAAVGTTIVEPEEASFPFPPLAPHPSADVASTMPDVGYDVRVRADSTLAHRLSGGALEVLVFPAGDDVRVTFTAKEFLGGSVAGRLDIGRHTVAMRYDVRGAQLAPLPENAGSSVQFSGAVTGGADITIKVLEGGGWDKLWRFSADTSVVNLQIARRGETPWSIGSQEARLTGDGVIHAARKEGIRLEGLWKVAARRVAPSWNPKGNDALALTLKGSLAWPPQAPREVLPSSARPVMQRRGLNHIYGDFGASGTLFVPLGRNLVPLSGALKAKLDWVIDKSRISLRSSSFDGLGSYVTGDFDLNASGRDVEIAFPATFKLAPRELLKAWKMLPGEGVQLPRLVDGKAKVRVDAAALTFGAIDMQVDGAPVRGEVSYAALPGGIGREGLWKAKFTAQHIDIDTYFPPKTPEEKKRPPSREPWQLRSLDGMNLDGALTLQQSRFRNLALRKNDITFVLQRNKFSFASSATDFYGGKAVAHAQGTLVPEKSQVALHNAHMDFKNVDIGKALYDVGKDTSYGGKLDIAAEFSGVMACDADVPAALSGDWSLSIQDGLYPAFMGSETMSLRNTFSKASASGVLEKGVLRWKNFVLAGALVDMRGEGRVDLGQRELDFTLDVTVAKVPTVPVRFSGSFDKPSMDVRGARMVLSTAQAAGSTVFGLLRGVLELPGRTLRGVSGLFAPDGVEKTGGKTGR